MTMGRYTLFEAIASGGMASVHIGRMLGPFGFTRTVAIKRLHQSGAKDPEFLAMFLDEARLAARIHHPNVVATLDVVAMDQELLLVLEYVSGSALSRVLSQERKERRPVPHAIALDLIIGTLNGLHAAHEAKNERGEPLQIVHRDVSPQNILIGSDGIVRVLDFGIAKAVGGSNHTRPNQIKGKLRYLAPETLDGQVVTRASDIFAASIVLWEMLTGRRLFDGETDAQVLAQVANTVPPPPSRFRPHLSRRLDEVVLRGLARDPAARYPTAREMALALESVVTPVSRSAVSEWLMTSVGNEIRERDSRVALIEREGEDSLVAGRVSPPSLPTRALHPEAPAEPSVRVSEHVSGSSVSLVLEKSQAKGLSRPIPRWLWVGFAAAVAGGVLVAAIRWSSSAAALGSISAPERAASASAAPQRSATRVAVQPPALAIEAAPVVAKVVDPLTPASAPLVHPTSTPTGKAGPSKRLTSRSVQPLTKAPGNAVDRLHRRD